MKPFIPRYLGGPVMTPYRFRRYMALSGVSIRAIAATFAHDWLRSFVLWRALPPRERKTTAFEFHQKRMKEAAHVAPVA